MPIANKQPAGRVRREMSTNAEARLGRRVAHRKIAAKASRAWHRRHFIGDAYLKVLSDL